MARWSSRRARRCACGTTVCTSLYPSAPLHPCTHLCTCHPAGSLKLLHTLSVGCWVYSLALCDVAQGPAQPNTVYAGCADGVIRCWNMSAVNIGKEAHLQLLAHKGEGCVRALACHGAALYSGGADGKVRAWDLSAQPAASRLLQASHTAAVRAIDADVLTKGVYSAASDKTIKVWHEANFAAPG